MQLFLNLYPRLQLVQSFVLAVLLPHFLHRFMLFPFSLDDCPTQHPHVFWSLDTDRRSRPLQPFERYNDVAADQNVFLFTDL